MFCVLRTRWSIPTDFRRGASTTDTPHCPPLRARKARVAKNEKPTPIDDGLHATQPSNGCDQAHQSLFLESLVHLTLSLTSHQLLVLPTPFSRITPSLLSAALIRDSRCQSPPQGQSLSFASDQHRLDVLFAFTTLSNLFVCGCIIGTSAPPSRSFTASDYYSSIASFFCDP